MPSGPSAAGKWRSGFLRGAEVDVISLDHSRSRAAGELCGAAGSADVIDASVVLVAREHHDIVITSDASDLRRLDPKARIVAI